MSLEGALPRPWLNRLLGGKRNAKRVASERGDDADVSADARFGGGDDRESEWVTVHRAPSVIEAQIVRGALVAADLPVLLRNHGSSALPGVRMGNYVDVQVPRTLEDRARAVLDPDGRADRREDDASDEEDGGEGEGG